MGILLFVTVCVLIISQFLTPGVFSLALSFVNQCEDTVCPAVATNAGFLPLQPTATGFCLHNGESNTITAPTPWEGHIWGRTHCSEASDGNFICRTGDCASGTIECGAGVNPPVTLVEFTFCEETEKYSFALSLVYGYNVAMRVTPSGGIGENCTDVECTMDLNGMCPAPLKVTDFDGVIACKSACGAFGRQDYCCTGAYDTHETCRPSYYSKQFKIACSRAYTYTYDDVTSIFSCYGGNYLITFCPSDEPQIPAAPTDIPYYDADTAEHTGIPMWLTVLLCVAGVVTIGVTIKIYITIQC